MHVPEAARLWKQLRAAGTEGLVSLEDRPSGMREFVVTDPDSNHIRVGRLMLALAKMVTGMMGTGWLLGHRGPGERCQPQTRADLYGLTTPRPRLARHPTEGVTIMATHNEFTDPSAGSSSVGRRSRWVNEHGLLAYTLIAYGISWSLLIGGFDHWSL